MAKILYGIMGNTHGHVMRSRAIMNAWRGHEFYIVGGGRVPDAFRDEKLVLETPVLRTVHRNQSVDIGGVVKQISQRVLEIPRISKKILKVIETWQPDLAICDREFFLPFACRKAGLRCISVNHSHVLLKCRYPVALDQRISWALAMLNDHLLFNRTRENCIVSFFHPSLKNPQCDKLFSPVLRHEVLSTRASRGDHILVYQTSATFPALIQVLENLKRPAIVYGFKNQWERNKNITFKPYHQQSILEDLASCAYAVVNGGHNLISEALFFGKPIFCFPIANLFEQFLNAWYVRALGYGDFSTARTPTEALFYRFEKKLEQFKIPPGDHFNSTPKLVQYLETLL
ncbi:MAG: glycosyltransferase family protein [Verrucomicrobiota bacterium]